MSQDILDAVIQGNTQILVTDPRGSGFFIKVGKKQGALGLIDAVGVAVVGEHKKAIQFIGCIDLRNKTFVPHRIVDASRFQTDGVGVMTRIFRKQNLPDGYSMALVS